MALDGPYDGGTGDHRPERHLRSYPTGADSVQDRAEPAEPRTRAEYYEALRAVSDKPAHVDENGRDTGTGRSGWNAIDAEDRPDVDTLRVTPERATHILDGDKTGGGHRHGTGRPGKTEFPANWDDRKIIDCLVDVARWPSQTPGYQEWNNRWVARGTRDDVEIVAIVTRDGRIWSGWPLPGGAGVVKNPEGA